MPIGSERMSTPSILAQPANGSCSVASTRIVEDLPAPLGPMKPNTPPRGIAKEMPRTASNGPYFTHRLKISTIGCELLASLIQGVFPSVAFGTDDFGVELFRTTCRNTINSLSRTM